MDDPELFDRVMGLPAEQREAAVRTACEGDERRARRLLELVEFAARGEHTVPVATAAMVVAGPTAATSSCCIATSSTATSRAPRSTAPAVRPDRRASAVRRARAVSGATAASRPDAVASAATAPPARPAPTARPAR